MGTFLLIPLVMGLGVIDQNIDALLTAMESWNPADITSFVASYARIIGACIALGVGANECLQMILGRRGMDVMKILHIILISFCITFSPTISELLAEPGYAMEKAAKNKINGILASLEVEQQQVCDQQQKYIDKVRETMAKMEEEKEAVHANQENTNMVLDYIDDWTTKLTNSIKEYTLLLETTLCEWLSIIIRFIGELLLQIAIYGLLVCERIFLHILSAFAPLMFALSLSPHFKSAWSQWLSKYVSVSLWGFVAYTCCFYAFHIMLYNLIQDQLAYALLMSEIKPGEYNVAAIGMQCLGSTCMYVVGCLIGVKALSMVPEVASWLIPGGVASGAGAASAGTATAAASTAGSMAGGFVGGTLGAAGGAVTYGTQVAGTMNSGSGAGVVSSMAQNTGLGNAYNAGRQRGHSH